jgi:hypothetical protein
MEMLSVREIASVKLFKVEVSEAELDLYERCMKYIYENFTANEIEDTFGAYADELLGIREDILNLLEKHTDLRSR